MSGVSLAQGVVATGTQSLSTNVASLSTGLSSLSTSTSTGIDSLSTSTSTGLTGVARLSTAETFTAAQRGAFVTLTDASTVAWDMSLGNQYFLPIAGSRTLGVPTNIVAGLQGWLVIRQDATGSRLLSYAWCYEWPGGTVGVLSTAGCSRDAAAYSVDFYYASVVTITIAAPGVINAPAHGMTTGQRFQLATTGALPTGLAAATTYFASVVDADNIKACSSLANAAAGTFITTTGSQSGVQSIVACSISMNLSKAFA